MTDWLLAASRKVAEAAALLDAAALELAAANPAELDALNTVRAGARAMVQLIERRRRCAVHTD